MRVHHLAIRVRSLERVCDFYTRVLGLRELGRPREGAVWLDLDPVVLMLERVDPEPTGGTSPAEHTGLHLLAFAIGAEERDAWEALLAAHGVAIVDRTAYTLYVCDPEGNRVGLSTLDVPRFLGR